MSEEHSLVNQQLLDLEQRYEKLLDRVRRLENRQRGVSTDDEERIMKWLAIAYVVSMLLPPILTALADLFRRTDKSVTV